jgi:hypothetical protein
MTRQQSTGVRKTVLWAVSEGRQWVVMVRVALGESQPSTARAQIFKAGMGYSVKSYSIVSGAWSENFSSL